MAFSRRSAVTALSTPSLNFACVDKPTTEFFSCGHACVHPGLEDQVARQMFPSELASLPSETYHLFTDATCGQRYCNFLVHRYADIDARCPPQSRGTSMAPQQQLRYEQYNVRLVDLATRLTSINAQCLSCLPGLAVEYHSDRINRLFEMFPGCLHGDNFIDVSALRDNGDVQAMLGRVLGNAVASPLPGFAVDVLCSLIARELTVLEVELEWLEKYATLIQRFEIILWENSYLTYDQRLSSEEEKLARQCLAYNFFSQAPLLSEDAQAAALVVSEGCNSESDVHSDEESASWSGREYGYGYQPRPLSTAVREQCIVDLLGKFRWPLYHPCQRASSADPEPPLSPATLVAAEVQMVRDH